MSESSEGIVINLELQKQEVEAIMTVLGDLPTKSNAWPLIMKINQQAAPQVPAGEEDDQQGD
jgi:hypothetical protein